MTDLSPERIASIWSTLEDLAGRIGDTETRERYVSAWRERYDAAFPRWLADASIVRLPDWKHVGEISDREKRQAKKVSDDWIALQRPDPLDHTACCRFAWELGRRAAAALLDAGEDEEILFERVGSAATSRGALKALNRGRSSNGGEALIAAIVLDLRCSMHPCTDMGLALRFRDRHGHDFHHTTAKGWLRWDGKRWKLLDEERGVVPAELLEAVFDTVLAIQREARAVRATGLDPASIPEDIDPIKFKVEADGRKVSIGGLDVDDDGLDSLVMTAATCRLRSDALGRYGRSCEERKRINGVPDLARRWLTVRIQDFDTDPFTINCQNGTLRLVRQAERAESGEKIIRVDAVLSDHAREDLLTKIAAVPYDPDATCPNYDGTIGWAQPKPAMRRYLHQWGGYNLTGDMGAQIFHMWWGPLAQNGKSTILDAWADCAGDYAEAGKIETFMEASQSRGGDAATPALAKLPGVRMLRTGEPPNNAKFDESLINTITGQDTLQIRDNFRSFFAAKMSFKLTVACNAAPAIPNATEGIKRRIKVVPFEKTMKGALKADGTPLRDENFKNKLIPELPGILAALVRGALDWLEHGFIEPDDVTQWTEEYKDENDPLGRFLSYCVVIDAEARIQASKFHELFQAWAKATGGPEWSMQHLKKKMVGKGYSQKQSNGMQWLGLKAVHEKSDFVDDHGNVIDLSNGEATAGGATSARAVAAAPPDLSPDDPWLADDDDLLGD